MIPRDGEILIRECQGFEEFDACVRLQTEVWGYDVRDTIPLREFIVIQRIGGQVFGAFSASRSSASGGRVGDNMIGFAMAMPGVRDGKAYLHSHMLAVLPEYRNQGIGRRLKLAQRKDALSRGLTRMEWTFDPLEIKNAYLNIARLGVVVRHYSPNFYGVFSSRLQAGLPTDRLHAEWLMESDRVARAIEERPVLLPEVEESIVVPAEIRAWKDSPATLSQAGNAQTEIRQRFLGAFARGLAVVGFRIGTPSDGAGEQQDMGRGEGDGVYQLAKWHEP